MTKPRPVPVHAVVRYDSMLSDDPSQGFTVKEILPSVEEAFREAERLNESTQREEGTLYFVLYSRYYPNGRAIP